MRSFRAAIAIALTLSVAFPLVAAAGGGKAKLEKITLPGNQAECDAIVAAHPELAGQPCVITMTTPADDQGGLIETARAASGRACSYIKTESVGWWVREDFCWQWNGTTSSVDWANCTQWNVLVGIDVTWCSWYNGWARGYNYADVGANWKKSLLVSGFPVATSCWMRKYLYNNGSTAPMRGAC